MGTGKGRLNGGGAESTRWPQTLWRCPPSGQPVSLLSPSSLSEGTSLAGNQVTADPTGYQVTTAPGRRDPGRLDQGHRDPSLSAFSRLTPCKDACLKTPRNMSSVQDTWWRSSEGRWDLLFPRTLTSSVHTCAWPCLPQLWRRPKVRVCVTCRRRPNSTPPT